VTQELARQTSAEVDPFIEKLATALARHGWGAPALLALEAGRPLAFIGGQLLWLAQPALTLFMSGETVRRAALLLEDPEAVAALVDSLETAVAPSHQHSP
jgi:hypothetical protein